MSSSLRVELIPASGEIALRPANFFFMLTASAAVTVRFQNKGGTYEVAGISAGFLKAAIAPWERVAIIGAAGTSVTYFYGDEAVLEDVTDFRQQIAIIGGTVAVVSQPTAAIATPARVALAAAVDTQIVAANALRKKLRIQVPSTEVNSAVIGPAGSLGAAQGLEIQPGTNEPVDSTAAVFGRGVGAVVNVQVFEET